MRAAARSALAVALVLIGTSSFAQVADRSGERGFPLITVYGPRVHQAGPQTFAGTQDSRGLLYFATLAGVGVYDGAWWKLLELPNESAALAAESDSSGRVAIGGLGDLGFVAPDATGTLTYRSLVPLLPAQQREVGEVTAICRVSDGFLFLSDRALYKSDGRAVRQVADFRSEKNAPRRCFELGDQRWLASADSLRLLDVRTFRLSAAVASLAGKKIDALLSLSNGHALVAVRDGEVYDFDGTNAAPFAPAVAAWLKGKRITSGVRLPDGRLVITTRVDGIVVVREDGSIDQIIDAAAGLPEDVLESSFVDRDGALWLTFDGPIARIDLTSPVSLLDTRRGVKGSPSGIAHFHDRLYVGTSHGLFWLPSASSGQSSSLRTMAQKVEGLPSSAWDVLRVDDDLIIGTERGVFRLDASGKAVQIEGTDPLSIYSLVRSSRDPSRVWIASQQGLASIRRQAAGWTFERIVPGSREYVSSVVEEHGAPNAPEVLWCGTVFEGVQRVVAPTSPHPQIRLFGSGETNVFRVGGRVLFVRAKGEILSLNSKGEVVPDPLLGHITAPRGFFVVAEDRSGNVWINSRPPQLFEKRGNGVAREGTPLVQVDASDIQLMRVDESGVVWFGTDRGLFRYESRAQTRRVADARPMIRRVIAGSDKLLFGGIATTKDAAAPSFPYGLRRVRIEFAPLTYAPGVMYEYRLDPVDTEWSRWSDEPFVDYTNLHEGTYEFRLRSRSAGSATSPEAVWSFTVMPPWYRAPWMIFLWIVAGVALLAFLIRLRTTHLRRDAERLRTNIAERTEELRRTVEQLRLAQEELVTKNDMLERLSLVDDLTGVSNRRFFQQTLTDEWKRAMRRGQPLALILLDLDHFKVLNDTCGHLGGDAALREVGKFLAASVRRAGDVVARYGGEEFAILLPATDSESAARFAEVLRKGIAGLELPEELRPVRMTASCGVAAMVPTATEAIDTIIERADRALYFAKQSGRNQVKVADEVDAAMI